MRISDCSSAVCASDLLHAAGGLLLDLHADIHLVLGACHQLLVDLDRLEVAESLQSDLRAVDRRLRVPRAFELAHFTAQHAVLGAGVALEHRSEEHTSELQSLMRISYAVFCLKKKTHNAHTK